MSRLVCLATLRTGTGIIRKAISAASASRDSELSGRLQKFVKKEHATYVAIKTSKGFVRGTKTL
jgi:hypothetical protein